VSGELFFNAEIETAPRAELSAYQLTRARGVVGVALQRSPFYLDKYRSAGIHSANEIRSLDDFRRLPFTTKSELVADHEDHPPFGTRLTEPLENYSRLHQTSGTRGKPLRILDTEESYGWFARGWGYIYRAAGVGAGDRVFAAFSFGPFIGFWTGFEGAALVGAMRIPGGGQTTEQQQRIQQIFDRKPPCFYARRHMHCGWRKPPATWESTFAPRPSASGSTRASPAPVFRARAPGSRPHGAWRCSTTPG
jgi:phenylacetate-CoA ligase